MALLDLAIAFLLGPIALLGNVGDLGVLAGDLERVLVLLLAGDFGQVIALALAEAFAETGRIGASGLGTLAWIGLAALAVEGLG